MTGNSKMAIKTTRQQLEEVQAAIERVLQSQEQAFDMDRVKRPDLAVLYKREDELMKRLASEEGGGPAAINTGILRYE